MSPEAKGVSEGVREDAFGSLGSCLVEGNSEQQVRARRLRRRALILSVLTQTVVLTLLLLAPLFGKTERIDLTRAIYTPLPPYGHHASTARGDRQTTHNRHRFKENGFVFHTPNPNAPIPLTDHNNNDGEFVDANPAGTTPTDGPGCSWCVDIGSAQPGPPPPPPTHETAPRVINVAHIDPGMLVYRVEPKYPPLAIHTHREGRVELRAMIATDGSIESLQIVVSDPLFNQSAVEAVQQWRYRPTLLNGQAVRVDTYITVFYKMQR